MTEDKLVPELRFPEFEDNWEKKKLGEILKVKYGQSQKEVEDSSGKYPILGTGGIIGYTNEYLYDKESVLIGRKGTIDEPVYINKPFWTIDTLFYTEIDFENNNAYWIYSSFLNVNWYKYNEASGVPSLNITNIENIKMKIPSKKEQNKIGDFFSSIDKKIELQEELIENLEEQKKGLMQKIFNQEVRFKDENGKDYPEWEEKKLGEIANYKNGGSNEKYVVEKGDYYLITLNSVDINGNLKRTHSFVNDGKWFLEKDDIVMVLSDLAHGNFLGLSAKIPKSNNYVLNQRMGLLRINTNDNITFVNKYINYNQEYFKKHGQGSSQQNLRKNDILKFKILLPVKEEQNKIANFLSLADKKIDLTKKELEQYKQYKKSLMQRMFI